MLRQKKLVFFVKREIPLLFFVNCERADLFFVKRDLYPPLPPSLYCISALISLFFFSVFLTHHVALSCYFRFSLFQALDSWDGTKIRKGTRK